MGNDTLGAMEDFVSRHYRVLFVLLLGTIVILAFYVGMLQGRKEGTSGVILSCTDEVLSSLKIVSPVEAKAEYTAEATAVPDAPQGAFAGSKNGTKYYAPGCAGLERIKPENRVWFKSVEDATLQGYTAAAC
jgi:hypothetical protein